MSCSSRSGWSMRGAQKALDAAVIRPAVDDDADLTLAQDHSSTRSFQRRMRSGVTSRASRRPDIRSTASSGMPPPGFLLSHHVGLRTVPAASRANRRETFTENLAHHQELSAIASLSTGLASIALSASRIWHSILQFVEGERSRHVSGPNMRRSKVT